MTYEELWEQLHKNMIKKLEEVMPIINEDSEKFIDIDWNDATGSFNTEWIEYLIVNIKSENRMDEVMQLIASRYNRMLMNGERKAFKNGMPEYGIPKHLDILGVMLNCKKNELARRKANKDDDDLIMQMRNKYKKAAGEPQKEDCAVNRQLEAENERLKAENEQLKATNEQLLEKMDKLKETTGFTCGQFTVLLFAVAREIEKVQIKSHLGNVFATITGYSANMFHNKLAGRILSKDKQTVYEIIKDELPNWAEAVSKL